VHVFPRGLHGDEDGWLALDTEGLDPTFGHNPSFNGHQWRLAPPLYLDA
jgi:hypothetical protein